MAGLYSPVSSPAPRRFAIAGVAGVCALLSGCESRQLGAEQTYPSRAITIVVTFAPGGGTDLLARELGAQLAADLGQPVVIENQPGASGNIGAAQVAQSAADGYRLLMVNSTYAINPSVFSTLNFSPKSDLVAVANVGWAPSLWVVPNGSPYNALSDLLEDVEMSGKTVAYASCGNGTPQHLAGERLTAQWSPGLLHIPYRGCGAAVMDVAAGQVPVGVVTAASATPHLGTRLKALAITAETRAVHLPDVPTVAEAGFPQAAINQWHGLLAPAGTPDAVIDRLNTAINTVVERTATQEKWRALGITAEASTAQAFQTLINDDIDRFKAITAAAGLRAD